MTHSPEFDVVVRSAAKLQELVPDMVLVGGSAAALHAEHRVSLDHDHVLHDLAERYAAVVDAVESSAGWATSVRASHPPMTLMGSLDGVQAGIRQLRRTRPLETERYEIDEQTAVTVPTIDEIFRIKAFLLVDRGAVRDFLDVAALADRVGLEHAASLLSDLDSYYAVRSDEEGLVSTQVVLALADPHPTDPAVLSELSSYKNLAPRWREWESIVAVCKSLAVQMGKSS